MRPAAPTTALGRRNPFDPMFDAFWSLANDAGITVLGTTGTYNTTNPAGHAGIDGFTISG